MALTWKFKKEIEDLSIFDKIGEMYGISFPEDLKKFIMEANSAIPSKKLFTVTAGGAERVYGQTLYFASEKKPGTTRALMIISGIEAVEKGVIPFAVDPFGNCIGYSVTDGKVVFYDHECDEVESTGKSLSEFINSLY